MARWLVRTGKSKIRGFFAALRMTNAGAGKRNDIEEGNNILDLLEVDPEEEVDYASRISRGREAEEKVFYGDIK